MLVSVHADSAPNPRRAAFRFTRCRPRPRTISRSALAEHENEADLMGGMDLPPADKEVTAILFDLEARRPATRRSTPKRASFPRSGATGGFWNIRCARPISLCLRAPDVPSMLVETGFLSNPQDERF